MKRWLRFTIDLGLVFCILELITEAKKDRKREYNKGYHEGYEDALFEMDVL